MKFNSLGMIAFLMLIMPSAAVVAQPSIADFMSAPFSESLAGAGDADRFAWVENHQGLRNVWTAEAPEFRPQRLTNYQADDGQALGALALSPDGRWLVYVRGGAPNRAGEIPNPAGDPDGASREVWVTQTDGRRSRSLGAGSAPTFSPDGAQLVFLRKGVAQKILMTDLKDEDAAPEPLFNVRRGAGDLAWSPQGKHIAFVSTRGRHSFIGVYDLAADRIQWIAPGFDQDSAPAWSPDGTRLAFLRFPGLRTDERPNLVAGQPFSVWIADPSDGQAKEIWASPGADGGHAQRIGEALLWLDDDRLVFQSEHDDWLRPYVISAKGGAVRALTSGSCELGDSAVAWRDGALTYSTNCEDRDRRHLRRVDGSGATTIITSGEGIEVDPVLSGSGAFLAYRAAAFNRPMSIAVRPASGGAERLIETGATPNRFPADEFIKPQAVDLTAADGTIIPVQLFLPRGAHPGDGRASTAFFHGGPIRQMMLGFHRSGYYSNAYAFNQYLANQGYVAIAVNFRAGTGYGRRFRLADGQGPRGASEHQDLVAAGEFLRDRPETAPDRGARWGGSYGGVMTSMGLARNPDLFAAGLSIHGVYDWSLRGRDFGPDVGYSGWSLDTERELELAYRSSAVAAIDGWRGPVLLIHGDDDRNVLFDQSINLIRLLRDRDVPVETLVLPDEVHGFLRHKSWLDVFEAGADFFERRLPE